MAITLTKNIEVDLQFVEGAQNALPLQSAFGAGNELGFDLFTNNSPCFYADPGSSSAASNDIAFYAISDTGFLQYTANFTVVGTNGGFAYFDEELETITIGIRDSLAANSYTVFFGQETAISVNGGVVGGAIANITNSTLVLGYNKTYNWTPECHRLYNYPDDFGSYFNVGNPSNIFNGHLAILSGGAISFQQCFQYDDNTVAYTVSDTFVYDGASFNVICYEDIGGAEIHLVNFTLTAPGAAYSQTADVLETDDPAINANLYDGFFFVDNELRTWCFIAYDGAARINPVLFRISADYTTYDLYNLTFDAATQARITTYLAGAGKFTTDFVPALAIKYSFTEDKLFLTTGNEPMFYAISEATPPAPTPSGGIAYYPVGAGPSNPIMELGCTNYCLPLSGAN